MHTTTTNHNRLVLRTYCTFFKEEKKKNHFPSFSYLFIMLRHVSNSLLSLSPSFPCVCKWSPTQQPFIFPFLIEFHNTIAYILYLVYIYTIIHVILLYDFFVCFFFLLALFRVKKQLGSWSSGSALHILSGVANGFIVRCIFIIFQRNIVTVITSPSVLLLPFH